MHKSKGEREKGCKKRKFRQNMELQVASSSKDCFFIDGSYIALEREIHAQNAKNAGILVPDVFGKEKDYFTHISGGFMSPQRTIGVL